MTYMKLEVLEEFVMLAKTLNFSVAARKLYISQPTLSTHMMSLEKELGFPLLIRKPVLALTPSGEEFLDFAQETLDNHHTMLDRCRALSHALPPVKINTSDIGFGMSELITGDDSVPVTFVDPERGSSLLWGLIKNLVDISITFNFSYDVELMGEAEENNIVVIPLPNHTAPLEFMMMRDNPLAGKPSLSREDLRGAMVVINSGYYFDSWKALLQHVLGEDLGLRYRLNQTGDFSNLAHVGFGDAIHICNSTSDLELVAIRDDIVCFDGLDGAPVLYESCISYRSDNENPAVSILAERIAMA